MATHQNFQVMLALAATTVQAQNPSLCTAGSAPSAHGSSACCACVTDCDNSYARIANTGSLVSDSAAIAGTDTCCNAIGDAATYTLATCNARTCTTTNNFVHPSSNTCATCVGTEQERVISTSGTPGSSDNTDVCCAKVANIQTYNAATCAVTACNGGFTAQTESSVHKCCTTVSDAATYTFATCNARTCTTTNNFVHPASNTCATCVGTEQERVISTSGTPGTSDNTDVCCAKVANIQTYNAATCAVTACNGGFTAQTESDVHKCCTTVSDAASYTFATCNARTCTTTNNLVHPNTASNTCATCVGTTEVRVLSTGTPGTNDQTDVCCTTVDGATSYNITTCAATCGSSLTSVTDGSTWKCCTTSSTIVDAVYDFSTCAASCTGKTLVTSGSNQKCCATSSIVDAVYDYTTCEATCSGKTLVTDGSNQKCCATSAIVDAVYTYSTCAASCTGKTLVTSGSNQKCCATSSIVDAVYTYSTCAASCTGKTLVTSGASQKCCTTVSSATSYNFADCAAVTSTVPTAVVVSPTAVVTPTTPTVNTGAGGESAFTEQGKGLLAALLTLCACCGSCCLALACFKNKVIGERATTTTKTVAAAPAYTRTTVPMTTTSPTYTTNTYANNSYATTPAKTTTYTTSTPTTTYTTSSPKATTYTTSNSSFGGGGGAATTTYTTAAPTTTTYSTASPTTTTYTTSQSRMQQAVSEPSLAFDL